MDFIDLSPQFFQNKYFIATAIPLLLIVVVAPIRKLTRGTKGFRPADFYLGMDLALAALTTDLLFISDGMIEKNAHPASSVNFVPAVSFLAIILFLLFVIMSLHQDWESEDAHPTKRFLRLSLLSNFLGAGLLLAFILLVKGV